MTRRYSSRKQQEEATENFFAFALIAYDDVTGINASINSEAHHAQVVADNVAAFS